MKNIMKKIISLVLALCAFIPTVSFDAVAENEYKVTSRQASLMAIDMGDGSMLFVREDDLDSLDYVEIQVSKYDGTYLFANQKGLVGQVYHGNAGSSRNVGKMADKVVKAFFTSDGEVKATAVREGFADGEAEPKLYKGVKARFVQLEGEANFRFVIEGSNAKMTAEDVDEEEEVLAEDLFGEDTETDEDAETIEATAGLKMTMQEASIRTIVTEDDKSKVMMIRKSDLKKLDYVEIEITRKDGFYTFANKMGIIGEVYGREDRSDKKRDLTTGMTCKNVMYFFVKKTGEIQYMDYAREGYVLAGEPTLYKGDALKDIRFVQLDGEDFLRLVIAGGYKPKEKEPDPTKKPDPKPTATPKPTDPPKPTATPKPTPDPTHSPRVTPTPAPDPTHSVRVTPAPAETPAPEHSKRGGN